MTQKISNIQHQFNIMGLKISSKQFRDSILQLNISTPPDIVIGLSDLIGSGALSSYEDSIGKDPVIKSDRGAVAVRDPGNITDISIPLRLSNLNKNLQTPKDIVDGIEALSPSASEALQHLGGRGIEAVLHDYSVINPGSIDNFADVELKKLFSRNIKHNSSDPSESNDVVYGDGYNYSSLLDGIGKLTTIHDYNVPNLTSLSINSNATSQTLANLALQQNRYMPTEPNQFEVVVNQLESFREPYVNLNTGMMTRYQPQEYTVSQFLGGSAATDTISQLGSDAKTLLKTDTVLMNIAAMELKFNFENRILNTIERKTIGRTFIDEALTNPLTAIRILTDPAHNLFERNWDITVGSNFISKAALLASSLSGVQLPVSILPESKILMPGNYNNITRDDWNVDLLKNTGGGQKFALKANLSFNKYTPSDIFHKKQKNAGEYTGSDYTIPSTITNADLSSYGKPESDFAWIGKLNSNNLNIQEISSYANYKTLFRKGSIMDVTQSLMDDNDDGSDVSKSAIDQSKKKLDDGYRILSKGSGVLGITLTQPTGEETRNKYGIIPNRNVKDSMKDAEFCRVWTKDRPYSKISDAIRFKELIRRERNSVIDANANYNIFPTAINVNEGYGRPGTGLGDATTEAYGERRARKYMFSLENLAWRDSALFRDLPFCERGSNGGRIMWFPPYDIKFTDDSTANYTTHTFLGRPEPIYTYNNTERSGSLSFKIVVDHPSILNTLVKYELANMDDNDVDEIITSFWSGCVEYDVFELARIWGVLSDTDINYFKNVLADLQPLKSNVQNVRAAAPPMNVKPEKTDNKVIPVSNIITNQALYFENDIPFPTDAWGDANYNDIVKYFDSPADEKQYFSIKPFDVYFDRYKVLCTVGSAPVASVLIQSDLDPIGKLNKVKIFSGTALKSALYNKEATKDYCFGYADKISYAKSIGNKKSGDYFNGDIIPGLNYFGFEKQKIAIENEIKNSKYNGYDLTIDLTAFSSPVNPSAYNLELAERRFKSVAMWIMLKVLTNTTTVNGEKITLENIDNLFLVNSITFYKNANEKVTINKKVLGENVIVNDVLKKEFSKFTGMTNKVPTFEVEYDNSVYSCLANPNSSHSDNVLIGRLDPKDSDVKRFADIVCSDLSIVAARARRVDIKITASKSSKNIDGTIKYPEQTKRVVAHLPGVTKREIVQKLLNKLVNECDYFDYLKDNSPVIYNSLKDKLKYFQPAFHAMTPEGLNARMTFLQQCLRPGETIKATGGCQSDAVNTSFGKPPICVLRIGDLYNTKIVINNLNINYDPLVWDLNPEGIGAQPMLADVQMSFKYIGGSGLRKYVEQLQNALSFNYYGNTDMYDDRTFANTDIKERNLINLEENFFAGNTLDLAKIIELKSIKQKIPDLGADIITSIGTLVNTLPLYTVPDIQTTEAFVSDFIYAEKVYVVKDKLLYRRLGTFPESIADVSDTKIWSLVTVDNYGEIAFISEYGSNSIATYNIDYENVFTKLYESYITGLGNYVGLYKNFNKSDVSPIMLNFLMKQKYGLNSVTESTVSPDLISGFKPEITTTLFDAYDLESKERNYKPYYDLGSIAITTDEEIIKLHLYPQDKFYIMNDGLTLSFPFNKINPGPLKSIYLKDKSEIFDVKETKKYFDHHVSILEQKIQHDLVKFINQNPSVFDRYTTLFSKFDKSGFQNYLINNLREYITDVENGFETSSLDMKALNTSITETADQIHKLSLVLNGNDGLGDRLYLEVIPNGTVIKDATSVFGYNPYESFPIVQYNTTGATQNNTSSLYSLADVMGITLNKSTSLDGYEKFLKFGNGGYFFKQVSKDNAKYNKIVPDGFVTGTYLPYITALETSIIQPLNIIYRQYVGLLTGGEIANTTKYDENTTMTSTFEKLNHEMLDFSNKTLSIMVNDSISDSATTFDTYAMDKSLELKQQLNIFLNGKIEFLSIASVVNSIVGKNDIYPFNFVIPTVVNNDIVKLNESMNFKFTMTKNWVDNFNNDQGEVILPTTFRDEFLNVNYYDELLMLGFYKKLIAGGLDVLIENLNNAMNVGVVGRKSTLNPLQQKINSHKLKAERGKLITDLVGELQKFVDESTLLLKPINVINEAKISDFSKMIRKTLFGQDSSELFTNVDYQVYAEKMLKKSSDTDYTLLMRKTEHTDVRTKSLLNKLYNN